MNGVLAWLDAQVRRVVRWWFVLTTEEARAVKMSRPEDWWDRPEAPDSDEM